MCGIIGYIGKRSDAGNIVFTGLKSLEYRGYDSWGIALVPRVSLKFTIQSSKDRKTRIIVKKKAGKIGNASLGDLPASSFAFGHTRWATHGGVTGRNAHPHLDCTGTLAIVHNGIIENYEEMKKALQPGHRFRSDTDTEVVLHLIEELAAKFPMDEAVRRSFSQLKGLNAMILMDTRSRRFFAARNGSPLVIGLGEGENLIASDAPALLPYTKSVYFLEDHELAIISEERVDIRDVAHGKRKSFRTQHLSWDVKQAQKGRYPHFMLKEIHEQPALVAEISRTGLSQATKLAERIDQAFGTYLIGCGTASYAAIAGSYLFSKISGRHVNWAVGSEFGYHADFLTSKSLVIALSQSGETMDTLEAVKAAKAKGAKVAALVNVLGSTLYREADEKILIGVGQEKAVATTKAFTGKLAHLLLIAYAMAGKPREGQAVVLDAARAAKQVLFPTSVDRIRRLARSLKHHQHIYVIGRGLSYPASLETALKIKEISYIHAEGFAAGELKHGVIALVEEGTPCIAFLPNDETYGANLAGAMEMKARGGMIVGISYKPHEVFDQYLEVPDVVEATIIPNVIVAQMLAYELSVARGLDPDMPRNLAKSVTVK